MANLVQRATSDMLNGPDWAMNMELCDLINSDPGIAKDCVKAVKKRMRHKNPKIQYLSLTVLETMVKNCGDYIHHQIATKDILPEMVKIAKKNKDHQVREKVLFLLDSWQEAFGGPRGRYSQYFMAYDELQRAGIVFPRRSDTANPIFTPPQTHPIAPSYGSPRRSPPNTTARADPSRSSSDLPGLSLSDIHNARSGMEVLAEMLNAVDPKSRQALKDEVIVELVEQCRTAERRVVQLVNSTSDEELLRQGLALNDDLKRVLAKHDAIASGAPLPREPSTAPPLIDNQSENADDVFSQLRDRPTKANATSVSSSTQPALPAPVQPPAKVSPVATTSVPTLDLLSGESYQSAAESSFQAPLGEQKAASMLALISLEETTSGSGFQTAQQVSAAYHNNAQQSGQKFSQENGSLLGNLPVQANNNHYVVPWAQPTGFPSPSNHAMMNASVSTFGTENVKPNGSILSPQQAALIYGSTPSGSSLNPQQAALIYGSNQIHPQPSGPLIGQQENLAYGKGWNDSQIFQKPHSDFYATAQIPNVSQSEFPYVPQASSMSPQPGSSQGYQPSHQSQSPSPFSTSHFQQEQSLSPGSFTYSSLPAQIPQGLGNAVPAQIQQGFSVMAVSKPLPPAPWSTESATSLQGPNYYANSYGLSAVPQDQSLYHHQMQQQALASSQFEHGSYHPAVQMQNLSLQQPGSYHPAVQMSQAYMAESNYPMYQKQTPPKKEPKDDGLFKDLVDLAKVRK